MSTIISSLTVATKKQRSSSFCINILNENSPSYPASFLPPVKVDLNHQSSVETQDSYSSPTPSDQFQTPKAFTRSRPRIFSTTICTKSLDFPSGEGSFMFSPEDSQELEILYDDDEEIKPKDEVHILKESDIEISIEMITKEMIMSSKVPLSYPCHISIKPVHDLVVERPSMDLLVIIDVKDRKILSLLDVFQKFLPYLSDKDRLSLFTTQGALMKRFPFRVMDEPAKSEFINEYFVLGNVMNVPKKRRNTLNQVFESSLFAFQQRRWKGQVSAVMVITDTNDEINVNEFVNKGILKNLKEDLPLVFVCGMGQKHDAVKHQNVCEDFEGQYSYVENCGELYEAMKGSLGELGHLQGKNMKISLKLSSDNEKEDGVKILKVFDKKGNLEESTRKFKTQRNYYSRKDGIELGLEMELPKSEPVMDVKKCVYYMDLKVKGESVNGGGKIEVKYRKEFVIKILPSLLCQMPKQIDRIALENFCRVKAVTKCLEVLKVIDVVGIKQSVQTLEDVRKELCAFSMFKSEVIHRIIKKIEKCLAYLEEDFGVNNVKNVSKFLFVREMNTPCSGKDMALV